MFRQGRQLRLFQRVQRRRDLGDDPWPGNPLDIGPHRDGGNGDQRGLVAVGEREVHPAALDSGTAVWAAAGRARLSEQPYRTGGRPQLGAEQHTQGHMGSDIAAAVRAPQEPGRTPALRLVENAGSEPSRSLALTACVHDPQGRPAGIQPEPRKNLTSGIRAENEFGRPIGRG
jgi:hypothetical protein